MKHLEIKQCRSFRCQLMIYIIAIVSLFAFIQTLLFTGLAVRQISQNQQNQVLQMAQHVALQSTETLRSRDADEIKSFLKSIVDRHDLLGAAMFTDTHHLLFTEGDIRPDALPDSLSSASLLDASDHWVVAAPVLRHNKRLLFPEPSIMQYDKTQQLLGFIVMQVPKCRFKDTQQPFLIYAVSISILLVLLCLWFITFKVRQLTTPISTLNSYLTSTTDRPNTYQLVTDPFPPELQTIAQHCLAMTAALDTKDEEINKLRKDMEAMVNSCRSELGRAHDSANETVKTHSEHMANISHELRTPLQAIIGYIELVLNELNRRDMQEQADDLKSSLQAAERLLVLINSLLDSAKQEADLTKLSLSDTSLTQLIIEIESIIRPLALNHNNILTIETPSSEVILRTDKEKTQQILINLLSNACKFTRSGSIDLKVTLHQDCIAFMIKDNGIGISSEQLQSIFDRFSRACVKEDVHYDGTGLGLSISRNFAHMMGGDIHVTSLVGEGSRFTLTLPYSANDNDRES